MAEHWRKSLNHLRQRNNKPARVNTRYRAANVFFKWLLLEGERTDNPLDRIESRRVPETCRPTTGQRLLHHIARAWRVVRGNNGVGDDRVSLQHSANSDHARVKLNHRALHLHDSPRRGD